MPVVDQNAPIFPEPNPDPATGLTYDPTRGYLRDTPDGGTPMDAGYVGPSEIDPADSNRKKLYAGAAGASEIPDDPDKITPAAAPVPEAKPTASEIPDDPGSLSALKPEEEPWWLKAAEYTFPPLAMGGAEAATAAGLGALAIAQPETAPALPVTVPAAETAAAGGANYLSDEALNYMRKLAGVPQKEINPYVSVGTGMAGSILGKAVPKVAGMGLRALASAPTKEAVDEAGQVGADLTLDKVNPITGADQAGPLRKAAGDLSAEVGGIGTRESLGIPADIPGSAGLSQPAALEHVSAQDSALRPVGRLFEKKGKEIGDLLEPVKNADANTAALGDAAHMTPEGAFGGTIGDTVQKNGMKVSPGVQKMFQEASAMGDQGTEKVGVILGKLNTIQEMLGKKIGAGDRYVLSELRDQYLDIAGDADNIPPALQQQLKGPRAEYRTLKDYYKGFYGVGQTTSPAETGEFLWKQQPRALTSMLNEATPEETTDLANATGQYITGDGKNTGAETVKRFNELKKQNPDALKKMFGEGPFSQAETWADVPKLQDALIQGIRDPQLQGSYVQGWQQGVLNTPEAQALASARQRFMSLPKPEQARIAAQVAAISKPEGARNIIGGQRFFLARMIMFAPLGIGVAAHHPEVAMGLGALYAAHEGMAAAIRDNPEMYLKMLQSANSKTAQGIYRAGYYASRIAMYDSAAWLNRQMQDNAPDASAPAAAPEPAAAPTP